MDPLEMVIHDVKNQKAALAANMEDAKEAAIYKVSPDERRELKRIVERNEVVIEALDYVLTFLENQKEEPCQD